jgi:folate-binding protein YgfZ
MVALAYLSVIRFSGTEAGDFLHNQLSADVLGLALGDSTFACYCEPKGRVLALLLVARIDDDYYVIMSRSLVAEVVDRLKIYVMRSKVVIEVLDKYTVTGLQAEGAAGTNPNSTIAIPVPASNNRFLLTGNTEASDSDPEPAQTWKNSELHRGVTWLGPETSAQFLPQMLGFDQLGAVNYRKGCYPGQEIVARTHYLGKVKRHPRVLNIGASICPGPLEKIRIISDEQSYEAIVADCGRGKNDSAILFVVTRMDPDLAADHIEYEGNITAVF